jgi:glutamyl-tRNA synthetase
VASHIAGGAELAAKLTPDLRHKLIAAMPGLKERAKTLVELVDSGRFLFADRPLPLDDKAKAVMTAEARTLLAGLLPQLATVEPWTPETTEQTVRVFAEQAGVKLGAIAQPLRAALTGRVTSPGIFEVLAVLGKSESLGRLADQAAKPMS